MRFLCRYTREAYLELVENIRHIVPGKPFPLHFQLLVAWRKWKSWRKLGLTSPLLTHLDVTLSSDFIAGFCGETEEEHRDTVSIMKTVKFDMAYMFAYSMRKVSVWWVIVLENVRHTS